MTLPAPVDLATCDQEPIAIPGSVQPHGALLAFGDDQRLVLTSANAASLVGGTTVGTHLEDLIGAQQAARLLESSNDIDVIATQSILVGDRAFDVAAHRVDGLLITEFEPADAGGAGQAASFERMRGVVLRLSAAQSVAALCDVAAAEVRALTGFDRVMIYRFDEHWNGEVVAEERREDLNPFLGLHYPATDIPEQARALYRSNWLRLIADVGYVPSPLTPAHNPLTGGPVDLSSAVLRSVSPIHIEYLTNMGVSASMSISLLHEGELWGLIACHHYSGPHRPSQPTRAAAEFLGQVMSLLIAAKQRADDYERTIVAQALQNELSEAVTGGSGPLADRVAAHGDLLLQMVGAAGAAVCIDGTVATAGRTPPADELGALASVLLTEGTQVASTAALARDAGEFAHLKDVASGVLAASVTPEGADYVLWFRPEVIQTVDWGGDPQNKILTVTEDDTVRLSPRKSFDLWKETVQGTSLPWTALEHDVAAELGRHLAGLVLQGSQSALDVARTLQRGLIPDAVPYVAGLQVASRYIIGGEGDVGGDWFDLLDLPGAGVAVVIGDVAGHGISAATTMGELRHAVRAYLLDDDQPASVLGKASRLTEWLLPGELATCLIAIFDRDSDRVRMASAGHLPPLLLAGGRAEYVELDNGAALGVRPDAAYVESSHRLGDATLLLYTDGLVERRGESIDDGLARLADACRRYESEEDFVDRLIREVPAAAGGDDLAVVAVRRKED